MKIEDQPFIEKKTTNLLIVYHSMVTKNVYIVQVCLCGKEVHFIYTGLLY